jgi:histidine phosphotransferase ChpT
LHQTFWPFGEKQVLHDKRLTILSHSAPKFQIPLFRSFHMVQVTLDALDLSALLCSRVCHDVISPVGAIVNGLEVLEDESDPSMKEFALDLIRKSARQASARLQFARIAFGAAGSAGSLIDIGDAEQVAKGFFQDDKITLNWTSPRILMPKNQVKLLLNLIVIATGAIPRGGSINLTVSGDAEQPFFELAAKGINARIPAHAPSLMAAEPENGSVDAHGIQAYYAGMIARAAEMQVDFAIDGETVTIKAYKDKAAEVEEPIAQAS